MSRNNSQKLSNDMYGIIVPGQFGLLQMEIWEAPSLMYLLDNDEQTALRKTFGIRWSDLDVHMRLVNECFGTGTARGHSIKVKKGVKVVYELNWKPEGIQVLLLIQALTVGVTKPLLDSDGYPRKITFERVFPESRLKDLFNKANAFMKGMESYKLALWAKEDGKEDVFTELGQTLAFFRATLDGTVTKGLTAKVGEIVRKDDNRKDKLKKIGAPKVETADDRTEAYARRLAEAATGYDPGVGIIEPEASASPTPAPKLKKDRPKSIKLGSPEAAEELARLSTVIPSNGSNGQS